ncbi:Fic family protein [Aequorivita sp. F47161]|uniref:Fic family protein n=1 Tax=Aequorivita vitellina TaxID=2874475 RepID=A0A9X1QZ90_9FLAO|nr:Fic family protein [Aequorivita vitellina]MCG2420087.1 Fic family protein [Aequorivita vitellina]
MELKQILERLTELKSEIGDLGKLPKEVLQKINYKFRLDWNYYSNRMEGGTLTREETRSVMVGNITVDGKPIKDVMEMNGHDEVVREILRMGKGEVRISEKRIKEIHKAILKETDDAGKNKQIGKWKTAPNEIINYKGEKISFTAPADVADEMHELLNKTNAQLDAYFAGKKEAQHPLIIAADFHLGFVTIHPFFDGNGRTARILMNLILIACGYPPIIITDNSKQAYYQYLADIQAYGGDKELMYFHMVGLEHRSLMLLLKAAKGEDIEEEDDLDKRLEMLKRISETDAENIVRLHKKDININSFVSSVINALAHAIYDQFIKLEPLFADNYIETRVDQTGVKQKPPIAIGNTIMNVFAEPTSKNRKEFRLTMSHLQYKKAGLKAFDVYWELVLKFEDSKYIITYEGSNDKNLIGKLYHQALSKTDIKQIAKNYFKYVLDKIEYNLENLNNDR